MLYRISKGISVITHSEDGLIGLFSCKVVGPDGFDFGSEMDDPDACFNKISV